MPGAPRTDETCGVTVLEGPSTEKWTSIKGIFVELYVHQGKKLSEVQRILADHCGFHATKKAYKRRIKQWQAFKSYKAADKQALSENVKQGPDTTFPSLQLYGKPVSWDRIKRFNRKSMSRRPRQSAPRIEQWIELRLHLVRPQTTIGTDERILFLTKAFLDWNVSAWSPLDFGVRNGEGGVCQGEQLPRMFNKCFYDAIPLLLTKHTSEAFKEINSACSLAAQCLQRCPYWIFLRLLRLHTYPLWTHFADIRSHIIGFLHVLASCTLPHGHVLRPLLELWTRANLETGKGTIAAILRLSSDLLGPSSPLEIEEWAWVQDEICSLHYQLGGFSDALVIAERFALDENVHLGSA